MRRPPFLAIARGIAWALVAATLWATLTAEPPRVPVVTWDKAQHGLAFLILALAFRTAHPATRWPMPFLVGIGIAIEVLQALGGSRSGDWHDAVADSIGVLTGWALSRHPWFDRAVAAAARWWDRTP